MQQTPLTDRARILMERCLQVVAVNRRIEQSSGGWKVLASVEIWDDALVLRSVETQVHEHRDPAEAVPSELRLGAFGFEITDDVGTEYTAQSSGGSGLGSLWARTTTFVPSPPPDATVLRLFAWDMQHEQPIVVHLTG